MSDLWNEAATSVAPPKVNMLVGFASSNDGTNLDGVVNFIADLGELGNQCPQDGTDQLSIAYDSNAPRDMVNALGPDTPGFQPTCVSVGAIFGNV